MVKNNKNLNYDSPVNYSKNKSLLNYNDIHNATPDKNENKLYFDSLNSRNMNDNKNCIKPDYNDNYLLKDFIEMMRNRQRIKSEEKNPKVKKYRKSFC